MKLFSLFKNGRVKPAWEFKTQGYVWRILFADSGKIVGEDRDQATKRVAFFCLDEETGEALWSGVMLEEKWWIGIETIYDDIVYLHEYIKPDLPQHFKIIALDLKSGKVLWRKDDLEPLFVAEGKVYAAKDLFEKRIFYELDYATGSVKRELSDEADAQMVRRVQERENVEKSTFPEVFEEGMEGYDDLAPTIYSYCERRKSVGKVEFIRHGDLLFFNYHERTTKSSDESPSLNNHLKVIDRRRNRAVFTDLLNEGVPAPTPDSFFLKGKQLLYVRNKNTLVAVRLEELQGKH